MHNKKVLLICFFFLLKIAWSEMYATSTRKHKYDALRVWYLIHLYLIKKEATPGAIKLNKMFFFCDSSAFWLEKFAHML